MMQNTLSRISVAAALVTGSIWHAAASPSVSWVPPGLQPGDKYHLVFVTSTSRDATSADIGDYDQHVQAAAANLDPTGRPPELEGILWRCVGTTESLDAKTHIRSAAPNDGDYPVYRIDGVRVADSREGMFRDYDGTFPPVLLAPINLTESGGAAAKNVWTGVSYGYSTSQHQLGTDRAKIGDSGYTDTKWYLYGSISTSLSFPFYAISPPLTVPGSPASVPAIGGWGALLLGAMLAVVGGWRAGKLRSC